MNSKSRSTRTASAVAALIASTAMGAAATAWTPAA